MNFKKKITAYLSERVQIQSLIKRFSMRLCEAMGLSEKDIETAAHGQITWDITGFTIFADLHPWSDWRPLLYTLPIGVPVNCGYSNIPGEPPSSWHFRPAGTATEILPPEEIQNEIIDRILSWSKNNE